MTPEALGRELHDRVALPILRSRRRTGAPGAWVQVEVASLYRFPDPADPPGSYLPGTRGVGKGTTADGAVIDFDIIEIFPTVGEQAWLLVGNGHAILEDVIRPVD